MLAALAHPLARALGGLGVAALIVSGAYTYGKSVGRHGAAIEALERSVELLRKRNVIDETVSASDAAALCLDFGLSDEDERECLRRLETPVSQP
ncbi:hypothetical protein [Pseudorhizobium flavum]|uniref:hypothetical protein n=1 Tax=Pseudorhizobium flavum TaxID=1335061 RepID=UPI002492CCFB|nr:hypothetical protein [Pseudorhizobium flavum]